MTKPLPIGISDYKQVIESDYYYVDKTLLIKELIQVGGAVTLITRPRRFGKTLNLSMLKYFFEKDISDEKEQGNSNLFTDKAIWQDEKSRFQQGQFPVIFLTFKDVKEQDWPAAYAKIKFLIAKEYQRCRSLIKAHEKLLDPVEINIFNQLAAEEGSKIHVEASFKILTELLQKITGKRVILLLDEYDSPIHAAYVNGYYNEMVNFMRSLLTAGLKDNEFLERSVLTGILRTAKEGIFSGLNNLKVCTFLDKKFSSYFGLTLEEVDQALSDYHLTEKRDDVKLWYNGYKAGNTDLYNPWSILNCIQEEGNLKTYWGNTSDNALIKKLLVYSQESVKKELESLMNDIPVIKNIEEAFVFPGIEKNERAVWSLLFFSGYITYSHLKITENGDCECALKLPNKEIRVLYKRLLTSIFEQSLTTLSVQAMMEAMLAGDVEIFSATLQEFIANSMSFYDYPNEEPEKSYHLFMLGLCVLLSGTYHVRSNRESGDGRYDIMLTPKDKKQTGVIIELKKAELPADLEKEAISALKQIKEKNYVQELRAQSIENIIAYGIAFSGKKLLIKLEKIEK